MPTRVHLTEKSLITAEWGIKCPDSLSSSSGEQRAVSHWWLDHDWIMSLFMGNSDIIFPHLTALAKNIPPFLMHDVTFTVVWLLFSFFVIHFPMYRNTQEDLNMWATRLWPWFRNGICPLMTLFTRKHLPGVRVSSAFLALNTLNIRTL